MTGQFWPPASLAMPDGSNLDAHQIDTSDPSAHAVEFSKTAAPSREGDSFADGAPERDPRGAGLMSIAPIPRTRPRPRRKPNRTRKDSAPTAEGKRPAPAGPGAPRAGSRQDRHRDDPVAR